MTKNTKRIPAKAGRDSGRSQRVGSAAQPPVPARSRPVAASPTADWVVDWQTTIQAYAQTISGLDAAERILHKLDLAINCVLWHRKLEWIVEALQAMHMDTQIAARILLEAGASSRPEALDRVAREIKALL